MVKNMLDTYGYIPAFDIFNSRLFVTGVKGLRLVSGSYLPSLNGSSKSSKREVCVHEGT